MNTDEFSTHLAALLGAVGARTPTPGGGAVAAWLGAMGASLGSMVVAYSRDAGEDAARSVATARQLFVELGEADIAAYERLSAAMKLKKDDPTRAQTLPPAVEGAIAVPRSIAAAGLNVLRVFESVRASCNPHMHTDLCVAAGAIEASVRGAVWMVRANIPLLDDAARAEALTKEMDAWLERAAVQRVSIEAR